MKNNKRRPLLNITACLALSLFGPILYAQTPFDNLNNPTVQGEEGEGSGDECQGVKCLRPIADYIKRLGANFGFNLGDKPDPNVQSTLLEREPTSLSSVEGLSILSYLGAIPLPISTSSNGLNKLPLVGTLDQEALLNKQAGNTFSKVEGNNVKLSIAANTGVDQTPLQADPLNQNLLNLISTPPICPFDVNSTGQRVKKDKSCVDKQDVIDQIYLPSSLSEYYKNNVNNNPALVNKLLNVNALISPLVLSSEGTAQANRNPAEGANTQPSFMDASSVQNANQFIQYVAGTTIPLDMPSAEILTQKGGDHKAAIKAYTAVVRTFAARLSVGLGNMYYILSKRIPQDIQPPQTSAENKPNPEKTSQALMEYKMATWRLFNTEADPSAKQWMEKLNTASPATIQKEMAMLLAEINYQLYLTRQQQERLLMTNSALLLISTNTVPPSSRDLDKELAK